VSGAAGARMADVSATKNQAQDNLYKRS